MKQTNKEINSCSNLYYLEAFSINFINFHILTSFLFIFWKKINDLIRQFNYDLLIFIVVLFFSMFFATF